MRPRAEFLVKKYVCILRVRCTLTLVHGLKNVVTSATPTWTYCAYCYCSRRDVSNTETLRRIGWPTLAWRRRRQKLSVLWDLLQQRGPPKLCDKVPRTAAQRCDYSLRNSSSPAIPLCRTFHRQNSFLPASLVLFNSLPASVTSCSSKPAFLSALDKYFLPDKFNFGLSWC